MKQKSKSKNDKKQLKSVEKKLDLVLEKLTTSKKK